MKRIKSVIRHLLRPGAFWSLPIAMIGISLLVFVFMAELQDTQFGIISYPFSLYSVAVLAIGIPVINESINSKEVVYYGK